MIKIRDMLGRWAQKDELFGEDHFFFRSHAIRGVDVGAIANEPAPKILP